MATGTIGAGGFGSDTTIPLPNAATPTPTQVTALELITALTNNGVGVEASNWLIKVLLASAQVTPVTIAGDKVTFTFDNANAGLPQLVLKNLNASAQSLLEFVNSANTVLGQLRADFTGSFIMSPGASTLILSGLSSGSASQGLTLSATGVLVGGRLKTARAGSTAVATTITLPDGNVFPLSVGAGTLNSIVATNWPAGSQIVLECASGITITHNVAGTGATILIPSTGANITVPATAGLNPRMIPLTYNGTNWIVGG